MDNEQINGLIGSLLSDPDAMAELRRTADSLGLGSLLEDAVSSAANESSVTDESSAQKAPEHTEHAEAVGGSLGGLLPVISGLAPALGALGGSDEKTRLLDALRPFVGEERVSRIDEAKKLLMLMRVIKALGKDGGGLL